MIFFAGIAANGQRQLHPGATLELVKNQRVSQPVGNVGINSLDGTVNATLFPGGDIGAQLNGAIAAVSANCGKVVLPPGSYRLTTQVMKPRCVWIDGNNAKIFSAIANPNIPAIVVGSLDVEAHPYSIGGIRDLQLVGPGINASTIGIYLGGPVAPVVAPAGNEDFLDDFENVAVSGFGSGYEKGLWCK
jgi:hypothetical protein